MARFYCHSRNRAYTDGMSNENDIQTEEETGADASVEETNEVESAPAENNDAQTEEPSAGSDESVDETIEPEPPPEPTLKSEPEPVPEPEPESLHIQFQRLRADFDNYRKRTQKEKAVWSQAAVERLVSDLLPVLDGYELGLKDAAEGGGAEGFQLVYDQLMNVLKKAGVTPVESVGAPYDPERHEVINQMPSPEVPEEHVLFESRRGYCLGERCIRPAQVVLSLGGGDSN